MGEEEGGLKDGGESEARTREIKRSRELNTVESRSSTLVTYHVGWTAYK